MGILMLEYCKGFPALKHCSQSKLLLQRNEAANALESNFSNFSCGQFFPERVLLKCVRVASQQLGSIQDMQNKGQDVATDEQVKAQRWLLQHRLLTDLSPRASYECVALSIVVTAPVHWDCAV